MKRFNMFLSAAAVSAVAMIAAPPTRADVDINFGVSANAPLHDNDLFFSISSRYFDRDDRVVRDWSRRFRNPDDLAVFFFVVRNSRMSADQVYGLRRSGMSWQEVGQRAGISYREWFVSYNGVPSGRYSRPYREYDRYRQNPRYRMRLTDREIRDLVAVRMAHEYYGVPAMTAMDWRRSGSNVQVIMTREYRSRHTDYRDHRNDRDHDRWHDRWGDSNNDRNRDDNRDRNNNDNR